MTAFARFNTVGLIIIAVTALLGCGGGRENSSALHASDTTAMNLAKGELTTYDTPSQNGTIAKRVFRDSSGRIAKTIYYRSSEKASGPYPGETLQVSSIVIHLYDGAGRERREEYRGPDMQLHRIKDTVYRNGDKTAVVWRRPDGIREYEIRYSGGREVSHLYFDESGERLVGVKGEIPADIKLAWGWGVPSEGLACGIGANCTSGLLKHLRIFVSVRNLTETSAKVITALQYHEIQVELRNTKGDAVPQNAAYIEERDRGLIRANHGLHESMQTIEPHNAGMFTGGFELREWYSDLPAGTYYLTVRRRGAGKEFNLVSNTLKIEIQDGN